MSLAELAQSGAGFAEGGHHLAIEVELEFRAQINAVAGVGLTPAHLDFHCLADGGRDDILDLTAALAAEYGLAVRVWLEPGRQKMRQQGLPVTDNEFLDSYSLDIDDKPTRYAQLLRDLPAGLSEWAVHPSVGSEESQAIDNGWRPDVVYADRGYDHRRCWWK